jgi:hypothetical protein
MTTNLLPMQYQVNRSSWKNLEDESNDFVEDNNAELYIIAGGAEYNLDRKYPDDYSADHPFYNHPDPLPGVVRNLVEIAKDENGNPLKDENGNFIFVKDRQGRIKTRNGGNEGRDFSWLENPKQIGIPEFLWKIIVPLRPGKGLADINENTQIVAAIMPNVDPRKFPNNQLILRNGTVINLSSPGVWETYAVTVDDVEELTGYNFFSQLPKELQNTIEARRNTSFVLNAALLADTETQFSSLFPRPPLSVNELPSGFEELSIGQNNTNSNEIAQIKLPDSPSQINIEQPSKIKHVPSGSFQVDVSHIAVLEIGITHLSPSESSPFQINGDKVSFLQESTIQINSSPVGFIRNNISQISFGQVSPFQVNLMEPSLSQFGSGQISPTEVGFSQISSIEVNSRQINSTQIHPLQVNPSKISLPSSIPLKQFLDSYSHTSTPASTNTFKDNPLNLWSTLFDPTFNINLQITDLPTGQLAEAQLTQYDQQGRPNGGTILIDHNATERHTAGRNHKR